MGYALIVFSSSTTASRLKRLAQKNGVSSANIIQTPKIISQNGCTYSIRCAVRELSMLKQLADEYGLSYLKIYRELIDVMGTKTYELY